MNVHINVKYGGDDEDLGFKDLKPGIIYLDRDNDPCILTIDGYLICFHPGCSPTIHEGEERHRYEPYRRAPNDIVIKITHR